MDRYEMAARKLCKIAIVSGELQAGLTDKMEQRIAAALRAEAERERQACADVLDERGNQASRAWKISGETDQLAQVVAAELNGIAAAIRARGENHK